MDHGREEHRASGGRWSRCVAWLVFALACAGGPAPTGPFVVANESSFTLTDVRVRPADPAGNAWGENRLESDLQPGDSLSLALAAGRWDVRCETRSGDVLVFDAQPLERAGYRLSVLDDVPEELPEALGAVEVPLTPSESEFVAGCAASGVAQPACRCLALRLRADGIDPGTTGPVDLEAYADVLAACVDDPDGSSEGVAR